MHSYKNGHFMPHFHWSTCTTIHLTTSYTIYNIHFIIRFKQEQIKQDKKHWVKVQMQILKAQKKLPGARFSNPETHLTALSIPT